MQREIERRQSRRNLGLGAELGGLGEGAAADAAAMDAAGNDTEEEKQPFLHFVAGDMVPGTIL